MILYEYPFNVRIRTYLRLEHLFERLGQLIARQEAVDHHFALTTLFEIIEVASRSELKPDVLKDIEKQRQHYNSFRGNPAISEKALNQLLLQLDSHFEALSALPGKFGQHLQDNDFLAALRNRVSIPGGTCEFDLPAYHAWQHQKPSLRQADLQRWTAPLRMLAQAIDSLLQMLREGGTRQKVMAAGGQLQQNLPQGRAFQLLRLRIDSDLNMIPEISCNRLLVVVRILQQQPDGHLLAVQEDVPFEMSLCA